MWGRHIFQPQETTYALIIAVIDFQKYIVNVQTKMKLSTNIAHFNAVVSLTKPNFSLSYFK